MQDTGPENHQAGSCKMGPVNDPWAVVDNELKVYGVKYLRVADTSIMPKVCLNFRIGDFFEKSSISLTFG